MRKRKAERILASLVLAVPAFSTAGTVGDVRAAPATKTAVVAQSAQPVPGGNGSVFQFSNTVLNNAGESAFWASLIGTSGGNFDDAGLYRSDGGPVTQIAREGQPAPRGNGTFSELGPPALNDAGRVAFRADLTGTIGGSNNNVGLYRGDGGPLTQIVREGQSVPGGDGTFFNFYNDPRINDAGQVAFVGLLTDTIGGSFNDVGLYRGDGQEILSIVVDEESRQAATSWDLTPSVN